MAMITLKCVPENAAYHKHWNVSYQGKRIGYILEDKSRIYKGNYIFNSNDISLVPNTPQLLSGDTIGEMKKLIMEKLEEREKDDK